MTEFDYDKGAGAMVATRVDAETSYVGATATLVGGLQPGLPPRPQVWAGFARDHPVEALALGIYYQTHRAAKERWEQRVVLRAREVQAGEVHTCPSCGREHRPSE
jgi:hypothetical protein